MANETVLAPAVSMGPIPGVQTFTIEPPGLGVVLTISIAAPVQPAIGASATGHHTIVYTTDADYLFGTVAEAARVGSYGGDLAPATVVGIGYAEEMGDFRFISKRRLLDFYRGPRRFYDAGAYGKFEFGGADAFLAALRDHVMPQVEQLIADGTAHRRILLGTSAGGHFAAYVLANDPALFAGYAMMSPMLVDPHADTAPSDMGEDTMAQSINRLPDGAIPSDLRVFLSAGEYEETPGTMFADVAVISNALRLRTSLSRRGIATEFVQFAGETHISVSGAAISRALRFLLPPLAATGETERAAAAAIDSQTEKAAYP